MRQPIGHARPAGDSSHDSDLLLLLPEQAKSAAARRSAEALEINLSQVGRWVVAISVAVYGLGILRELITGSIGTQTLLEDLRQIALDTEHSLPAWYSSLLMLGSAVLLFAIGRLTRRDGRPNSLRWRLLGLIFALMALDEAVSFHEILIDPVRSLLSVSGIFYFAWVIPAAVGVLAIGLFYLPFLLRLPRRTALFFALSGAVYVGGALGMELIGGALAEASGQQSLPYIIIATLEEGFEIAGLTGFFLALCDYIGRQRPRWASFVMVDSMTER